jgi:15-cis-phytoene synthase
VSASSATGEAYRHCQSITRRRAANFYYGIRLLPANRRRGMCAVYAFARRVDDIGDGTLDPREKLRRLDAQARKLSELELSDRRAPAVGDPVMLALADTYRQFSLPLGALDELIEGVRMDVNGVVYERFEELVLYCRRVAGAIGRVCLPVFGALNESSTAGPEAEALADDLGVAMQLTNILRDVREDAENGRAYLPAEDLRRFGLMLAEDAGSSPAALLALARSVATRGHAPADREKVESLHALMRFEAGRAHLWFQRGMQLATLLDRRSAACLQAMAGIYRRLLNRIQDDPERALSERMSLPVAEKAWVAARSMLGGSAAGAVGERAVVTGREGRGRG